MLLIRIIMPCYPGNWDSFILQPFTYISLLVFLHSNVYLSKNEYFVPFNGFSVFRSMRNNVLSLLWFESIWPMNPCILISIEFGIWLAQTPKFGGSSQILHLIGQWKWLIKLLVWWKIEKPRDSEGVSIPEKIYSILVVAYDKEN